MATSILRSQNFRFQTAIYLQGNGDFLAYAYSCVHCPYGIAVDTAKAVDTAVVLQFYFMSTAKMQ
jgi:hypothetical protein